MKNKEEIYLNALKAIARPIQHLQSQLKEGEGLDGIIALQLSNDADYLKGIAKKALEFENKEVEP